MPWEYIHALLGPGMHWGRSQAELLAAIRRAREDQNLDAAEHLEIILELRNWVCLDDPQKETPED